MFSKVTCSICNNNKDRVFTRSSPSGVKQYKDPNQKAWKGKKCPDCLKNEHKEYMRTKRGSILQELKCDRCNIRFIQKRGHQLFCSKVCRVKRGKLQTSVHQ